MGAWLRLQKNYPNRDAHVHCKSKDLTGALRRDAREAIGATARGKTLLSYERGKERDEPEEPHRPS